MFGEESYNASQQLPRCCWPHLQSNLVRYLSLPPFNFLSIISLVHLFQLCDPQPDGASIYSEELVLHLNDQIRVCTRTLLCATTGQKYISHLFIDKNGRWIQQHLEYRLNMDKTKKNEN